MPRHQVSLQRKPHSLQSAKHHSMRLASSTKLHGTLQWTPTTRICAVAVFSESIQPTSLPSMSNTWRRSLMPTQFCEGFTKQVVLISFGDLGQNVPSRFQLEFHKRFAFKHPKD